MATTSHNPSILLRRVFNLTESSPLVLVVDSATQNGSFTVNEFVHQFKSNSKDSNIVYLSFETINRPAYASQFIDATVLPFTKITQTVSSFLPGLKQPAGSGKSLCIIDSLNYIPREQLTQFFANIASPHVTVLGVYHEDVPELNTTKLNNHFPSAIKLLKFMSSSILHVSPKLAIGRTEEEILENLGNFTIPKGLNNPEYLLTLTYRRKSGRSLTYNYRINSTTHQYTFIESTVPTANNETPEALQGLTTFNLSTSDKQKKEKENVNLPFLDAQSFNRGGAIVYEFEKDDDYDEEDPYEDPF